MWAYAAPTGGVPVGTISGAPSKTTHDVQEGGILLWYSSTCLHGFFLAINRRGRGGMLVQRRHHKAGEQTLGSVGPKQAEASRVRKKIGDVMILSVSHLYREIYYSVKQSPYVHASPPGRPPGARPNVPQ